MDRHVHDAHHANGDVRMTHEVFRVSNPYRELHAERP
jgi:hypothetical protein